MRFAYFACAWLVLRLTFTSVAAASVAPTATVRLDFRGTSEWMLSYAAGEGSFDDDLPSDALPVRVGGALVPALVRLVEVPEGLGVQAQVNRQEGAVAMDAPTGCTVVGAFTLDDGALALSGTFGGGAAPDPRRLVPSAPVQVGAPRVFAGIRVVPVVLFLEQYDFSAGYALLNRRVEVNLTLQPSSKAASSSGRTLRRAFPSTLDGFILNPRSRPEPSRDRQVAALGRMLILLPEALEDEAALDQIEAFAEWKRRCGLEVMVEAVDAQSLTGQEIRDDIVAEHHRRAPLDYLVIIGDDRFPDPIVRDGQEPDYEDALFFPSVQLLVEREQVDTLRSDLLYAALDGDDYLPDFAVGRFWVPTAAQLAGALARSIAYENDPYLDDQAAWQERALYAVEYQDSVNLRPPAFRSDLMHWCANRFRDMGYAEVLLNDLPDEVESSQHTLEVLERGVGLAIADGWLLGAAHEPWIHDHIPDTGRRNPFIICNALYYDNWVTYLFFGSATPDHLNGPVGALTTMQWDRTDNVQTVIGAALRALRYDSEIRTGGLFLHSAVTLNAMLEHDPPLVDILSYQLFDDFIRLHLWGDPALELFTAEPRLLRVSHPDALQPGATGVWVTVVDGDDQPVEFAQVCLRQVGRAQAVMLTDASGAARFVFPDGLQQGTLQITVRNVNCIPYLAEINVTPGQVNLVLDQGGIDDSQGGDGDGVLRNGEAARLVFSLRNAADGDASSVTARLSCDDPHLEFSEDEVSFPDLGGGQSASYRGDVNVRLDPDWALLPSLQVNALVTSDQGEWTVSFELPAAGPRLEGPIGSVQTQDFFPGARALIFPQVFNRGTVSAAAAEVRLRSDDTLVVVVNDLAAYDAVAPGGDPANPDTPFVVDLSPHLVRGNYIPLELVWSGRDGHDAVIPILAYVEGPLEREPIGPDEYGYICYDSGDTARAAAPRFRWREINWDVPGWEFRGTRLDLGDVGQDAADWESTALLPLPESFTFRFYGHAVDTLVVGSNGWLGVDPAAAVFRSNINRPIPGWAVPDGQICPYWESLRNENPTYHGVYYHYLEDENVLIVEWSSVQTYNPERRAVDLDFQVLLFDSERYPTPTGDGEIVFQYARVDYTPGIEDTAPYATVGLRSPDGQGLEYCYWGNYHPAARRLENGLAIKFTTARAYPTGAARGRVVRAEAPDQPLAEVALSHPLLPVVHSGADGTFLLSGIRAGLYSGVTLRKPGFNPASFDLPVVAGDTLELGAVALTHPELGDVMMRPLPFEQLNLRPDGSRTRASLILSNVGNGPLTYRARLTGAEGETRLENLLHVPNLDSLANGRIYGMAYADSVFFLSGWRRRDTKNVYVMNRRFEVVGSFRQPLPRPSDVGLFSLTWDGVRLWGSYEAGENEGYLISFDRGGNFLREFPSPFTHFGASPLAWNPDRHTLLIAESQPGEVVELDTLGNELHRFALHHPGRSFNVVGLAWNTFDGDGMNLLIMEDSLDAEGNSTVVLHKADPASGAVCRVGILATPAGPYSHRGLTVLNNFRWDHACVALVEASGPDMDLKIYEIGPNLSFVLDGQVEGRTGTIAPNQSTAVSLHLDASGWPEGRHPFILQVIHNALPETLNVPVVLTISDTAAIPDHQTPAPTDFALTSVRPNPFNTRLRLEFAVPDPRRVSLKAYDLAGREVAIIYDGLVLAGRHNLTWDGSKLAAGIYFLHLQSGNQSHIAKVALLR